MNAIPHHRRPQPAGATEPAPNWATPSTSDLAAQVRDCAAKQLVGPLTATLDEHYTLNAVMLEHHSPDGPRTLCVELLDHGPAASDRRWMALAYDELSGRRTQPSSAATFTDALANLAWDRLDDRATPRPSYRRPTSDPHPNTKGARHA
jgi:hypothetical protein